MKFQPLSYYISTLTFCFIVLFSYFACEKEPAPIELKNNIVMEHHHNSDSLSKIFFKGSDKITYYVEDSINRINTLNFDNTSDETPFLKFTTPIIWVCSEYEMRKQLCRAANQTGCALNPAKGFFVMYSPSKVFLDGFMVAKCIEAKDSVSISTASEITSTGYIPPNGITMEYLTIHVNDDSVFESKVQNADLYISKYLSVYCEP